MYLLIMSEIRNLTRNGETFYPLTTSSAVINESTGEGLVIDEEPVRGSNNLVKSSGIINLVNEGNGECTVVLATKGYVNSTDGVLKLTGTGVRVMLFNIEGLTKIILQAFNKTMSAKYYAFYTTIENNAAAIDGKHDYNYGFNALTIPNGAKYIGVISMFNNVGSDDMFRVLSLNTTIKHPVSNIQSYLKMLPLLAVCPNMYVDYETGQYKVDNTANNSCETCIYDVSGLSNIDITSFNVRDGFPVYMSFYSEVTDSQPINGIQYWGKNKTITVNIPNGAKYLFILTKFNNESYSDNVWVCKSDGQNSQDKKIENNFDTLNSGLSIVPMKPVVGFLGKEDVILYPTGSAKSFTSDWISVSEGDSFMYLGFGSGASSMTPAEITEYGLGCSWLFGDDSGVVTAYAINNHSLEPYEVIIPSGITRVKFSSIYLFDGSYNKYLVLRKNTVFDYALLRPWYNKRWIVVGDSLTEANTRATKQYHDYVKEKTGITVSNYGKSGTGYKEISSGNDNYVTRIQTIPGTYSVLTIFGSGNDLHSGTDGQMKYTLGEVTDQTTDTICGCINLTLDWLQANRPLFPVGIVTPTPWASYGGAIPSNPGNRMDLYVEKLIQIANRHGVPVLDLFHCSMLHPELKAFRDVAYSRDGTYTASSEGVSGAIQVTKEYLNAVQTHGLTNAQVGDWVLPHLDGVHPDEHGHKLIAPLIENFIKGLML